MVSLPTFQTEMETTTFNYDYGTDDGMEPEGPCDLNSVNSLGAGLSILFYFMFLFSLFGNGLVLFIIHRFEKLTTVTNILLLNLVFSSVFFMCSLPFWAVYTQSSNWIFGAAMCKIVGSVYYLGFYSSVLFLTLLTFDRHVAVVYSLGAWQVRNQRYAVISCAVVWLVSALACIRPMILHNTFTYNVLNRTYCQEYPGNLGNINVPLLKQSGFYLQLILFLIFPLAVIIYCYLRIAITVMSSKIVNKFKTVRLIFVIVVIFFICWTPFNIIELIRDRPSDCEGLKKMRYALEVTRIMAYTYFCISPIFYTFVGKKFQSYFKQLLVKRFPGLRKHITVSQEIGTNMSTKSTKNEL
ncbi:C-C chemokine receptor type 3-like isoform X1 [Centropristis striata]|uniref:C-C chemokine receptor type 3-like isoform X1 n=1 Tax=Centropristis striata TaxID=184440 RepID=UPI0027E0A77C|nr:C-C chemokine receptor type 3-like isoform X1 [Centropristis striata]